MLDHRCAYCFGKSEDISVSELPEGTYRYHENSDVHVQHFPDLHEYKCRNCDYWWIGPAVFPD